MLGSTGELWKRAAAMPVPLGVSCPGAGARGCPAAPSLIREHQPFVAATWDPAFPPVTVTVSPLYEPD